MQNPATDIKQPTAIKNQHQLLVPGPGERAKRERKRKRKREKIDLERDPPWKWLISLFPPSLSLSKVTTMGLTVGYTRTYMQLEIEREKDECHTEIIFFRKKQ